MFKSSDEGVTFLPVYITRPGVRQSRITSIVVDETNSSIIYAAVNFPRGGVWKSTDGGANWVQANSGLPVVGGSDLLLYPTPSNPLLLYLHAGQKIFKSVDGARTWLLVSTLPAAQVPVAFLPAFPVLYYATGLQIFSSADDGQSWVPLPSSPLPADSMARITSLSSTPRLPGSLFVGVTARTSTAHQGFYKSVDRGASWTRTLAAPVASIALSYPRVFAIGAVGIVPQLAIYRSENGGDTWSQPSVIGATGTGTGSLAWMPDAPDVMYSSYAIGIQKSLDGGNTWRQFGTLRPTLVAAPAAIEITHIPGRATLHLLPLEHLETGPTQIVGCTAQVEGGAGVFVGNGLTTRWEGQIGIHNLPLGVHDRAVLIACPNTVNTVRIAVRVRVVDPLIAQPDNPPFLTARQGTLESYAIPPRFVLASDSLGNVYASSPFGPVIKITPQGETIPIAGRRSTGGLLGVEDGTPALDAVVTPMTLAADSNGVVYMVESPQRVRSVTPDGIIHRKFGSVFVPYSSDHGAPLNSAAEIRAIATNSRGDIFLGGGNRVVKISATGESVTVAGSAPRGAWSLTDPGSSGDGGPATAAELISVSGIATDDAGNLYIADEGAHRIRKVAPDGIITTIAGTGDPAYSGDGGPASNASLFRPSGLALDSASNLYILDTGNLRVRRVRTGGIIETLIGAGFDLNWHTDGGIPECGPPLWSGIRPASLTVTRQNVLYVADPNGRVFILPLVRTQEQTSVPQLSSAGVVNAASFRAGSLAAGSIASIFGTALANNTAGATNVPLPADLGGSSVCINGQLAPQFFVSPTQVNIQLPFHAGPTLMIGVSNRNSGSKFVEVPFGIRHDPGIFTYGSGRAVAQNSDGSLNTATNPARVGSVIVVYLTGLRYQSGLPIGAPMPAARQIEEPVQATIGGVDAQVLYLGFTQGFIGLGQANLRVPPLPAGDHRVVITVDGVPGNSANVAVRN